jgi:uncharacterized membrane protein YjjP (DUF1212 family)
VEAAHRRAAVVSGAITAFLWAAAITRDQNPAGYIVAAVATVVAGFFLHRSVIYLAS